MTWMASGRAGSMLIAMSLWLMTATTATMRVLILMGLIVLGIEGLPAQEPVPAAPPLAGEVAEALEEPEAPVGGEDSPIAPEEGPALPEPRLAELRHLVGGLASESFAVREGAQAALARYAEEHPDAVKRGLAEVYMSSQDPEQRYPAGGSHLRCRGGRNGAQWVFGNHDA